VSNSISWNALHWPGIADTVVYHLCAQQPIMREMTTVAYTPL